MIYVFFGQGFEEIEAVTPVDLLRRAELPVKTVGVGGKEITGAHGITVMCDLTEEEASPEGLDMIVLPGGLEGAKALSVHKGVRKQLLTFAREGKGLAAICAAPMILGELGILEGKRATIYPGMEEHLIGAVHIEEDVVRDINIITSQGPATAMEFALSIVEFFKGKEAAEEIAEDLLMRR